MSGPGGLRLMVTVEKEGLKEYEDEDALDHAQMCTLFPPILWILQYFHLVSR